MSNILVFCEFHNHAPKKSSLELLSAAKATGNSVAALALGPGSQDVASALAQYGASPIFVSSDSALEKYNPEIFADVVEQAIQKSQAKTILASSSALARDLFPKVAARLSAGIANDCTELHFSGDTLTAKKPLYSGKCSATVHFQNCDLKIVLMRPNQLPVSAPDASAQAQIENLTLAPRDLKTVIKEIVKGTSEKLDLTEANIIVSGGRGLKAAENFKLLEELADTLGATVGASRAVCDAGWVSHSMQVGQTGKTVAPSLYIACGISGAIQHLAGMSDSKVIVAINNDPEAPIFQKATYGIVGDLFEVVPLLTEEFKKLQH